MTSKDRFAATKRRWERELEWGYHWRMHRPKIDFNVRNGHAFQLRLRERNHRRKRDDASRKLQRYYETMFGTFYPKYLF